jgi:hypothetical protein
MARTNKNPNEIRSIFEDVCAQRGLTILVSQYMKFEGNFVHLDGNEVHARTNDGGEDALCILRVNDLSLRFPHKHVFMEANTKLIGLGMHDGAKTIRFALPASVSEMGGRKSHRVTDLDGSHATLSLKNGRLIKTGLADLSVTGTKLALLEDLPPGEFKVKERVMLSVFVNKAITIYSGAIIRHVGYRSLAVEFDPELPESVSDVLSDWIFEKREGKLRPAPLQGAIATGSEATKGDTEEAETDAQEDGIAEGGILFISRDDGLDSVLKKLLGESRPYCRVKTEIEPLRKKIHRKPHLVILHLADGGMDEIKLLQSLVESIPADLPILLLGTNVKFETLFELGNGWKVLSSISWILEKGPFLQRLVLGILRSRYGLNENPGGAEQGQALATV